MIGILKSNHEACYIEDSPRYGFLRVITQAGEELVASFNEFINGKTLYQHFMHVVRNSSRELRQEQHKVQEVLGREVETSELYARLDSCGPRASAKMEGIGV